MALNTVTVLSLNCVSKRNCADWSEIVQVQMATIQPGTHYRFVYDSLEDSKSAENSSSSSVASTTNAETERTAETAEEGKNASVLEHSYSNMYDLFVASGEGSVERSE